MFIKILGMKLKVEYIIICIFIIMLMNSHLFCGCITNEGFDAIGSCVDYVMNSGNNN